MPRIKRTPNIKQVVYLSPRLHKMLRLTAARDNRKRSEIVAHAVEKYLQEEKESNGNLA